MCIVNDILNSIIFEQYLSRRNSLHAFVSWNPQGVWVQTPSVAHSRMYSEAFNPFEHCEFRFHQQWSSKGDHYSQSSHTLRTSMFIVCMRPPMRIGYWHVGALPLTQQWCLVLSLQEPRSKWVHRQAAPLIEYLTNANFMWVHTAPQLHGNGIKYDSILNTLTAQRRFIEPIYGASGWVAWATFEPWNPVSIKKGRCLWVCLCTRQFTSKKRMMLSCDGSTFDNHVSLPLNNLRINILMKSRQYKTPNTRSRGFSPKVRVTSSGPSYRASFRSESGDKVDIVGLYPLCFAKLKTLLKLSNESMQCNETLKENVKDLQNSEHALKYAWSGYSCRLGI